MDRHTCAVMLELVQGEGGVVALEPAYVQAVRALCDEKDPVSYTHLDVYKRQG